MDRKPLTVDETNMVIIALRDVADQVERIACGRSDTKQSEAMRAGAKTRRALAERIASARGLFLLEN